MAKADSPFAGVKLSEQTPVATPGLDQRLFSKPAPRASSQVAAITPAKTQETRKPVSQETRKPGNRPASQLASQPVGQPANQETDQHESSAAPTPTRFDLNSIPLWKGTYLFTEDELDAMEDVKLELRRKFGLKTTKNELARCALQHLIEDYRSHGETSVLLKRLRNKSSR